MNLTMMYSHRDDSRVRVSTIKNISAHRENTSWDIFLSRNWFPKDADDWKIAIGMIAHEGSEAARRHRDEFTTPGGIHVRTNERTFLQFLISHCFTLSSWVRTSGASKNLALGPPSFFGPRDSIFHRFPKMKRDDSDHEATRRAQTWHASEVGCGRTGRTSTAAKNVYWLYDSDARR